MKREYGRLHERYTELFKTHCDYMERTKILFGTDRLDQLQNQTTTTATNRLSMNKKDHDEQQLQNSKQSAIDVFKTKLGVNTNADDTILNALNSSSREDISVAITSFLREIEKQQQQQDDKNNNTLIAANDTSQHDKSSSSIDAGVNTGILV